MVCLELRALTKAWPSALVSATLSAPAGRILSVAGPSGCGKSTLLRMAAGLERPDSGSVLVGDRDVTGLEPRDRGIGMVFQDYALFPHLDVAGNVAYGLRCRGPGSRERGSLGLGGRLSRAETRERVARLLAAVDLSGFERRRPHELSGGERQRVALARTLATEPRVVLFDEPLSSLDASLRRRLRADIVEEQRRLGFTALYVTHDLEEALSVGDRMAVMSQGSVLQVDEPARLWSSPADARVARFLGSGPCLRVLSLERRGGTPYARTSSGLFRLPPGSPEPGIEPGRAGPPDWYLFFERSAAERIAAGRIDAERIAAGGSEGARETPGGWLEARCLGADFAGDAVDCAMASGGERFALRFRRDEAPAVGDEARYLVRSPRLVPGERTGGA